MPDPPNPNKVVVLTGAGVSAESGLSTFRDSGGLWCNHDISEVATPEAWVRNPQLVLDFYNHRRTEACAAKPNAAHHAIARLEEKFEVVVVTQNVDDLHERAGSTHVIHVHGQLTKARSTHDENLVYDIGANEIQLGDTCEEGHQLRPHIVWFGEAIFHFESSARHVREAGKVLVIGTSLTVYPAAGLALEAQFKAEKLLICPDIDMTPRGYKWIKGTAAEEAPVIVERWMGESETD
ncbi:MAG: SIR2 family NAD-dependent protein deacylase [Planctomycetota bacterium]|jgi:NAD-dependent deacetylase